jgi:hypothetical protein
MIMVKIEIWPMGDESRKRDLAAIAIANVGGDHELGDYAYAVSHQIDSGYGPPWESHAKFAEDAFVRGQGWKIGTLKGFARRLGAVKLLARVLRQARL